jgi:hypothetical protein
MKFEAFMDIPFIGPATPEAFSDKAVSILPF